ncbi:unnamed protein product, partial [Chrysoparadoxa australica]
MRAFVEQMRCGQVHGTDGGDGAKMMRLRNTLRNLAWLNKYHSEVQHLQPRAPITGTTLGERCGLVEILVNRPSKVDGKISRCIFEGPVPVPIALYDPRVYTLSAPRMEPMPEPSYDKVVPPAQPNKFIHVNHRASWAERFVTANVADILRAAINQVQVRSPVSGADEIFRTKYPPPTTIKFATFARKATPNLMAVGGLSAEMLVSLLVSTLVPPQYGNFQVMQKAALAPNAAPDVATTLASLQLDMINQEYVRRPLQHPLNNRIAPS